MIVDLSRRVFNPVMPFAVSLFLLLLFLVILWTLVRWFAGVHGGAPFVPVPRRWLEEAFQFCPVNECDVVIDLGSGSGKVLKAAADRGARVRGYEFHPLLAVFSRWRLRRFGARARIIRGDLFSADLTQATVVTIFGFSGMREKLVPFLSRALRPGTRIVVFLAPALPFPLIKKGAYVTVYQFPENA